MDIKAREKIRADLERETVSDRQTMSFYFSKALLDKAKKQYPQIPPSRLLEVLLKDFLNEE